MKIVVLVENEKCRDVKSSVKSAHGLSLYIEFKSKKILLDLGPNKLFAKNAEKLGVDISSVDYLIISHGHYDHGGGLEEFLRINKRAKIYLHRNAVNLFYTKLLGFIPFYIGLKRSVINKNIKRITFLENDAKIASDIFLLTDLGGEFLTPTSNKSLLHKNGKLYTHDDFNHEILLVLEEDEKVVVLTACSHSGIVNMLNAVNERITKKKIDAVLGGLHLYNPANRKSESRDYINSLVNELKGFNATFYTGHCTGKENFKILKGALSDKIKPMNTGTIINI